MLFFDSGIAPYCEKCKLYKKTKNPFLPTSGKGNENILIITPELTEVDARNNTHINPKQLFELNKSFRRFGLDVERDCYITSATQCANNKPTDGQIKYCGNKIHKLITDLQPETILMFGTNAIKSVMFKYDQLATYAADSLSGNEIPLHDYDAIAIPLPGLSKVLSMDKDLNFQSEFKRVLSKAIKTCVERPILQTLSDNFYENIIFLNNVDDICNVIDNIIENGETTAFDFETEGIKPHKMNRKVTSMAISCSDKSYAFPVEYQKYFYGDDRRRLMSKIGEYLENTDMFKIAHNLQFEYSWSLNRFKAKPSIDYCTMISAHLLDSRRKITGLKHQVFVKWGLHGYDELSQHYIKSDSGSYGKNKMDLMPLDKQLLYVGLDAYLTMQLFLEQQNKIKSLPEKNQFPFTFFNKGAAVLAKISDNGIPLNIDWYESKKEEIEQELKEIEKDIMTSDDVQNFMNQTGKEFNFSSSLQLQEFLFDFLKLDSVKKTKSGKCSVDEESLEKIDNPVAKKIVEYRKLHKLTNTYINQFKNEHCNGYIHPNFPLHIPRSFRGSSTNPNFQNIPKRNIRAKETIRKGMHASDGCRLIEIDFSGIEVSTSAIYHQDKNFINYLLNDDADMHRDNAADIWMLRSDEVTKEIRFYIKNMWTFPQFYGDFYGSCAENLWENCLHLELKNGVTLKEHLAKKKVTTYEQFKNHCKKAEDILWNERFPEYTAWKNEVNQFYIKHGYFETKFGFISSGYLDKKQVPNHPIQGTAFHILLWCLIEIDHIFEEKGLDTVICGQIHDSGLFDAPDEEVQEVINTVKYVCEDLVVNTFPWINVPFGIDVEMSPVNGTYNELEEYVQNENNIWVKKE